MFFSVYGIISVCVCVSLCVSWIKMKNRSIPEGRTLNQTDIWAKTICVWAGEEKMAENSGRWLLMIKQWQHKCLEFWRSIFHLQLHSIQLKDASDVNKTPLLLNTLRQKLANWNKKTFFTGLQVQVFWLLRKCATPSQHLLMWYPTATSFYPFQEQLLTARPVTRSIGGKANGNSLQLLCLGTAAFVAHRGAIE